MTKANKNNYIRTLLSRMEEIVSVIIPCYNHGKFVREAINSVEQCDKSLYELIIVNDGSTDAYTNDVMRELASEGYNVINQQNQGLSKTRNNGIALAKGKYILPLDADNKIKPEYITYALKHFQTHPETDVVYSNAIYFGGKEGISKTPDFNLQRLMIMNFIDACALFRKSAWERIGGYDTNMKLGVEDWEYWLHLAFTGSKFHHAKEPLFYYRVAEVSMLSRDTSPNFPVLKKYIETKHGVYMNNDAVVNYMADKFKQNPFVFLFKLVLKTYFPKTYYRLAEQKKIRAF